MKERRNFPRVQVRKKAYYRLPEETSTQMRLALSEDLSPGGACLYLGEKLNCGREILCSFNSGDFGRVVFPETRGTVAWQDNNNLDLSQGEEELWRTGISFGGTKKFIQDEIRHWFDEGTTGDVEVDKKPRLDQEIKLISAAYDGSTVTYKILRAFGWGPLNNMGYFFFPSPFSVLNLFSSFILFGVSFLLPTVQAELVKRCARLLDIEEGDTVLDIACGRGRGSFMLASIYPRARVVGADLLPANIQVASNLYGRCHNLQFSVGDAMRLEFGQECFDKILCLEAAFHFPSRAGFIQEAYRVLKNGGRFVLVDFMWKTDEDRKILENKPTRLVRDTWQFKDFSSVSESLAMAREVGFEVVERHNWSHRVTAPLECLFKTTALLGRSRWGRPWLVQINPLLQSVTREEWEQFSQSAQAHDYVRKRVEYVALVLRK